MSFLYEQESVRVKEASDRGADSQEANLSASIWDELREQRNIRPAIQEQTVLNFDTASLYARQSYKAERASRVYAPNQELKEKLEANSESLRNANAERQSDLRSGVRSAISGAERLGDPPGKPKTGKG